MDTSPPPVGSEEELARFTQLQVRLRENFRRFSSDPGAPYTTVVIPSQSFDAEELAKIAGVAAYEERSLFNLMLLRHPRLRLIYVTSKRLDPLIVDYYLHQMRGVPPAHARRRLLLLDCDDATSRPLTEKIIERPRLVSRIADAIEDTKMAHMAVFNSTPLERTLSVRLGIPLNASDPELVHLGSKTGSRTAFRAAGVPPVPGRDGLKDIDALVEAIAETWEESPEARRVVVKLNESFSGEGNALLDLETIRTMAPGHADAPTRRAAIEAHLPTLRFEAAGLRWENYREQFQRMGGVCEVWVEGRGKVSPSVQLRINPVGEVQPISTHDQLLGGPSGQIFEGATFPADERYRLRIQEQAERVGEVLSEHGVIGRFAVDFLVVPHADGEDEIYAIEINLRQGGTTHSFNTLKFISDGNYDAQTGLFHTAQGRERAYFTTDTIQKPAYRGLLPFDLIDLTVVHGIHVGADEIGVVFHLLGSLSQHGKLGCTAIAETPAKARELYDQTLLLIDDMAANLMDRRPPIDVHWGHTED